MHKKFFSYVEQAKKITKFSTNVKLAEYLNANPQRISDWRLNRGRVEPADCVLLAHLLGISTEEIAFVLKAEKETNPEKISKWLSLAAEYARSVNPPDKYKKQK